MSTRPILTSGTRASTETGTTVAFTPNCLASALQRSTSKPTISRVFASGAANGGTSAKVAQRNSLRCWMSCHWSASAGPEAAASRIAERANRLERRTCMMGLLSKKDKWLESMRTQIGEKALRAWVLRVLEEGVRTGGLEDRARVHEPDAIGD